MTQQSSVGTVGEESGRITRRKKAGSLFSDSRNRKGCGGLKELSFNWGGGGGASGGGWSAIKEGRGWVAVRGESRDLIDSRTKVEKSQCENVLFKTKR